MITELKFRVAEADGEVSAILAMPDHAGWIFVFGHGAGAGMRHAFIDRVCHQLADRGIGTFRYQFPYMEYGKKRPNTHRVLHGTVRAAVTAAREAAPDARLVAGGKSMGGRMTSLAQASTPLMDVAGLIFLGFPLNAPNKPGNERADHLRDVAVPMLFLQGTRDSLADLTLLTPVVNALGRRATMHIVDGGDHSFKVLKRSGRTIDEVFDELTGTIRRWTDGIT